MRNRFLLLFLFLSSNVFASNYLKQVNNKYPEEISINQIYLHTPKGNIRFLSIDKSNIVALLGKPKRIKKFYSEMDDAFVSIYTYNEAEVIFDAQKSIDEFDIKSSKWGFAFKINKKFTGPFTIDSDANQLKAHFPQSFRTKAVNKKVALWIKNTDSAISISIIKNKIDHISFFNNNS